MRPPRTILLDLDDTLLTAYRQPERTWAAIIAEHADALGEHSTRWVTAEVLDRVLSFLADEEGRKLWRLEGDATRRRVVRSAFHRLNLARPPGSEPLHGVDADRIADRFETYLEEAITLKPGAREMLAGLGAAGLRLGLLTNGTRARQRAKIARFGLSPFFRAIQIEEEAGFGKPDPRAYMRLLARLDTAPRDAWMLGDDPVWDVAAPAALGLTAILYDETGRTPLPEGAAARIDRLETLPRLLAQTA
ncbi:phosphoglycolate phosphatase [Rhodovulum sulfidophilum]|uniref:HAD family hydrolase n=1 Tax=Rhodovulum visakhapatnamense TaxID=364297 RepID=A0ABS1RAP2_9RHOB|nr:HAD family hydrolase [Rhodovulum visakhapatnamense]MBL3569342.1 HAD family hydrolase [Rhodovulum visakhapatnamense]MBL3576698.1 HAD family hydrolase [Rhodovulum visakhapatnamense]OLS44262.1 phosphoglycolate phosphatase [Rhodovulum sulfidophilum]